MRKEEFRSWLEKYGKHGTEPMSKRPIDDALSRCNRIEMGLHIDLDIEYEQDRGEGILALLEYTKDAKNVGKEVPKGLFFKQESDLYNGMASLRSAVKKYFEFCTATK
ncbi:MAG: hypothetical protein PUI16_06885 [Clostridia bacterium]|nr:hypothetical protein [Clostridia bacterium]